MKFLHISSCIVALIIGCHNQNMKGSQDLILAAQRNDIEAIKLFLRDTKVDVNFKTPDSDHLGNIEQGDTALIQATQHNNAEIVEMLIKAGASIDLVNTRGDTALMHAIGKNNLEIMKELLNAGAKVNQANRQGETVLMQAMRKNHTAIVDLLLENGAKATVNNTKGNSRP